MTLHPLKRSCVLALIALARQKCVKTFILACGTEQGIIGERDLVVGTVRIFYDRTSSNCACSRIIIRASMLPDVVRIHVYTSVYACV